MESLHHASRSEALKERRHQLLTVALWGTSEEIDHAKCKAKQPCLFVKVYLFIPRVWIYSCTLG